MKQTRGGKGQISQKRGGKAWRGKVMGENPPAPVFSGAAFTTHHFLHYLQMGPICCYDSWKGLQEKSTLAYWSINNL